MVRAICEDSLEVLTILIHHPKQLQTTSQYINFQVFTWLVISTRVYFRPCFGRCWLATVSDAEALLNSQNFLPFTAYLLQLQYTRMYFFLFVCYPRLYSVNNSLATIPSHTGSLQRCLPKQLQAQSLTSKLPMMRVITRDTRKGGSSERYIPHIVKCTDVEAASLFPHFFAIFTCFQLCTYFYTI